MLILTVTFALRPAVSYRALELGVGPAWLGLLAVSFALPPLVVAGAIGRRADRIGERPVLMGGAVLVLIASAGLALTSRSTAALAGWNAVLGFGYIFSMIGGQSLAVGLAPAEGRLSALGHYTLASSIGQALGPGLLALTGGHGTHPDTQATLDWTVVVAVALLGCAVALPRRERAPAAPGHVDHGTMRVLLRTPDLRRAILTGVPVLTAVDLLGVYLPALGTARNLSGRVVALLLALRAAGSMGSRLFLGALLNWLGRDRLLIISVAGSAIAIATLTVPMPIAALAAAVVVAGVGLGVGQPLSLAWVVHVAPEHVRASAIALRLTFNRVALTATPPAVALVASAAGIEAVWGITAAALGGAACTLLPRRS